MAKNGHAQQYKAYVFKEKDPVISEVRALAEQYYGHHVTGRELSEINKDGGPSTSCMRAWFFGETKRPNNATIEAAGRAIGYQRVWKRMRDNR